MAAFVQDFNISSSADGLTLTFSDLSTYDTADEEYAVTDFSRQLVLLDSAGTSIASLSLASSALTAEITVTKDLWISATLTSTGISPVPTYTKTLKFPFYRIAKNLYRQALASACGCTNKAVDYALVKADIFFRGAELIAPTGDGVTWQTDIDAANAYLNGLN